MPGIGLLSNVTINAPFLVSTLRKRTQKSVIIPDGFDTWRQCLLDISQLPEEPDALFLVLDGRAYLQNVTPGDRSGVEARVEQDLALIGRFTAQCHLPLFVSDMDIPPTRLRAATQPALEPHAMHVWRAGLEGLGLPILELAAFAAGMGRSLFYSPATWYSGSLPWSMEGQRALAEKMALLLHAHTCPRKKVLVLDLDNTLWGGVVGEDGVPGLVLGGDGLGAAYRDFQFLCKELKEQGVLLAVVSKNNEEDALNALRHHPDMVLREKDFVAIRANWRPKAQNICAIAEELNLGTDAFVFVDDNPVERESVRAAVPGITVPDFPDHPAKLPDFCRNLAAELFPVIRLTSEDTRKTEDYQAEGRRRRARSESVDLTTFLNSLDMRLYISPVTREDVPRVAQLTQKTNQFNLTTRRYSENDILRLLNDGRWQLFKASLKDVYGDFGIILLSFVYLDTSIPEIDTFLMSCRAMGRDIEKIFLNDIEKTLYYMGKEELRGVYIPSKKNSMVKNFYSSMGFLSSSENTFVKRLIGSQYEGKVQIKVIHGDSGHD